MSSHVITGRVWVFGDSVNTDAMYPAHAMKLDIAGASEHVFYELRPSWTSEVAPGDLVIAGRNFGIGSSRPVAALFQHLGVAALVSEEFNSLFFRNAINAGLPALTVAGVTAAFTDGDVGEFDLETGRWSNLTTGQNGEAAALPEIILELIDTGGVLPRLIAQGFIPTDT